MSSTFLDDILTAPSSVIRPMIAAGKSTGAVLGNGTLLIKTNITDSIEHDYILNNGKETINFAAYKPGAGITPRLASQSLHLGNGVFTEEFDLPAGTLTAETLVLRQHAICAYQSLSLPKGDYTHTPIIPPSIIVDGSDHVISNINGVSVPCMRLRAHLRCDPCERYSYLGAYFGSTGVIGIFNGLDIYRYIQWIRFASSISIQQAIRCRGEFLENSTLRSVWKRC